MTRLKKMWKKTHLLSYTNTVDGKILFTEYDIINARETDLGFL